MPLPLLPVLGAIAEFLVANGTRAAVMRFGQQAVSKASQEVAKRQAAINARVSAARTKGQIPPKGQTAAQKEGSRRGQLEQRLAKETPPSRFDADGFPIDEIPLKFAEGDVVQGIGSLMDGAAVGGAGRAISDMDRMMADQGARQGISPVEQRMQMLQQTLEQSGRTISDEDASLFAMGEISFEDAMGRATSIPRSGAMAMQQPNAQLQMAAGGEAFPDLTGDGQVTQADILRGRGVFAEGGEASMDEVQEGLNELQGQQPEIEAMNQLIASVVEMVMSGVSEEEIMQFLSSKGLDDEEIQLVLQAAGDQLMQQQGQQQDQQQDPIQAEISQMA